MKIKYIVYFLIVAGVGALVANRLVKNNSEKAPSGNPATAVVSVQGEILKPETFNDNLSLSGSLEANEQVDIRSEVSGVVEQINFNEGSQVKAGQVLLRVNDLELRAQLSKVKTAQKLASENERRANLLLEKEAISQEEYDMASADYQTAKSESELIEAQLAKATIRAPFSGTIGLRNISKGTYVTPASAIAKLVNTEKLKLTFSIPEKYASRIQENRTFTFSTTNSQQTYTAHIYAVEPEVDVATRTLKMRAIVDNKEGVLYPGMFVNVSLPLETINDALMVPSEALIPIQNGKEIFIVEQGKAKAVRVETGARTDKDVRVLSGLKVGDTILTYGVMAIQNGTAVKVNLVNN